MKLSEKKRKQLYMAVHEEIMQARIRIARLLNDNSKEGKMVDEILFKLSIYAPEAAINIFK